MQVIRHTAILRTLTLDKVIMEQLELGLEITVNYTPNKNLWLEMCVGGGIHEAP